MLDRRLALLIPFALASAACAGPAQDTRPAWSPGATGPAYQGQGAQPGGAPGWGQVPLFERPVDVSAILALVGHRCAPKEVAPGTWARFDCGFDALVTRVLAYVPRMSFVSGPLPFSVDHRAEGSEGPIKSQGAVGACTAFSLSTAMDNAVRRMGRGEVIAPLHVWSKYAVPKMGSAGDQTLDKNITVEPAWPYDPAKACKLSRDPTDDCGVAYHVAPGSAAFDPQLRAEQGVADAGGRYRLVGIEQLQGRPATTDQLAAVLAGGDDVWASFWVNDQAWMGQNLQGGVIPDYVSTDDTGHAVVLAGYRTLPNGQRQFLVHNSWGPRWGDQGYGWISDAMVRTYLRSAYKIRVVDAATPGLPVPSGDGCPSGQVKDTVLGSCAALCASGSAPAAGVCLPSMPGFPAPGAPPGAVPPGTFPGLPPGTFPALPPGQGLPGFSLPFPLPTPAPGQPAPAACAAGQAPDLMTGACGPLCPNGAPTMGGMCLPMGR